MRKMYTVAYLVAGLTVVLKKEMQSAVPFLPSSTRRAAE